MPVPISDKVAQRMPLNQAIKQQCEASSSMPHKIALVRSLITGHYVVFPSLFIRNVTFIFHINDVFPLKGKNRSLPRLRGDVMSTMGPIEGDNAVTQSPLSVSDVLVFLCIGGVVVSHRRVLWRKWCVVFLGYRMHEPICCWCVLHMKEITTK